jgi:hypothetical protein
MFIINILQLKKCHNKSFTKHVIPDKIQLDGKEINYHEGIYEYNKVQSWCFLRNRRIMNSEYE